MKKTIVILMFAAFFYACNGGAESGKTTGAETTNTPATDPDVEKGLTLVAGSDCFGCHKVKETSIGPAYNLIAQKYENTPANIKMLTEKIVKGGSGVWGTVPMAAHTGVSDADASAMIKYVLSLKDEK